MIRPKLIEPTFDDSETIDALVRGLGELIGPVLAAGVPPDIVWRALDHVSHRMKERLQ